MPVKKKDKPKKVRPRSLRAGSGVGKFKNGMLKIGEKDIRRVNNSGSRLSQRGVGKKIRI
jgi:hypothetical protein